MTNQETYLAKSLAISSGVNTAHVTNQDDPRPSRRFTLASHEDRPVPINLCNGNVSPKTAQAVARHSDIRTTMNIYSHVDQEEQAAAIRRLGGLPPAAQWDASRR